MSRGAAAHTEFTRLLSEHGLFGCIAILFLFHLGLFSVQRAEPGEGRALAASLTLWSWLFMFANAMRLVAPSLLIGLAGIALVSPSRGEES